VEVMNTNGYPRSIKRLMNRLGGGLTVKFRGFSITLDSILLLLAPFTLWALAAAYVPIEGAGFNAWQAWIIALVILALMVVSQLLHALAHELVFHGKGAPVRLYLTPLGDPAQLKTPSLGAGKEALNALSGPVIQILLGGLFYVIWNLQLNDFISATAAFLIFFNLGMAAVNLSPVFPFDGGRLLRAAMWKLPGHPGAGTNAARRGGWGLSAGLVIWAVILFIPQDRYSLLTGGITIFVSVLIVLSLFFYKTRPWDGAESTSIISKKSLVWRTALTVLLILPLAAVTLSLLPLNQGLEAPGFTASVEPMVKMPAEYRHDTTGTLLLLTVIPQAPIITGEWFYAHIDHTIKLKPPEQIVPDDKSAQTISKENYRMLIDSETTAVIAGMRLAGYPAEVNNAGARITSVLAEAPSSAVLKTDDIITKIDGITVVTPADVIEQVHQLTTPSIIKMEIKRDGESLTLEVPTFIPDAADGAVKIGITLEQYSTGYTLPFLVEIVAEKVSGGPSAGLMFTLAVYDLLTGKDLAGGLIIAGTGTMDLEGNVGAIGGVQQKVAAAERAGAVYFLCPADNYADALAAAHIPVIKVTTALEAIEFLLELKSD
jgi:Lon-like protease